VGCTIGTSDAPPDGIPDFAMLSQIVRCASAACTRCRGLSRVEFLNITAMRGTRPTTSRSAHDRSTGPRRDGRIGTTPETDVGNLTHATWATLTTLKPRTGLDPVLARVRGQNQCRKGVNITVALHIRRVQSADGDPFFDEVPSNR
jgi:hypothetical protein